MNISDIFTNKNIDIKLSQYIVSGQKKIPGLLQEDCRLVIQAYNDKNKNLVSI